MYALIYASIDEIKQAQADGTSVDMMPWHDQIPAGRYPAIIESIGYVAARDLYTFAGHFVAFNGPVFFALHTLFPDGFSGTAPATAGPAVDATIIPRIIS